MLKLPTLLKPKRQLNLLIAGMFLALQMPLFLAVPAVSAAPKDDEPKKVYVCKYVGAPGINESLKDGKNPIEVSVNAAELVNWNGQVGGFFNDGQERSSVLGYVGEMTPEPTAANCPAAAPNVIAIPTVPVIDPCGLGNAVFGTVPAGNYSVMLNLNGSITLTANQGSVFTGGQASVTLPAPVDSGVLCLSAAPTAIATAEECSLDDENVGEISVAVTNTDDSTNQSVEYTVTLDGQVKKITLADGNSGSVMFTGLDVGNYTATVTGNDGTSTTTSAEVNECRVKVTLCHATGSTTNPYVKITISAAGAFNGHLDNDFGGTHGDHQNGEDIIPPFEFKGSTYEQNWDAAGQIIFNNDCAVPATPTAQAIIIPCVLGSGATDIVSVGVTNTDDNTNESVEYTVTLGGQVKKITLADGNSGSVMFTGLATGSYTATIAGDDGTTAASTTVSVNICEDEGDILGEVIPSGGQGVDTPAPAAPSVLADTGKDFTASLFAALAIIGATCALAITSRRARFNQ